MYAHTITNEVAYVLFAHFWKDFFAVSRHTIAHNNKVIKGMRDLSIVLAVGFKLLSY